MFPKCSCLRHAPYPFVHNGMLESCHECCLWFCEGYVEGCWCKLKNLPASIISTLAEGVWAATRDWVQHKKLSISAGCFGCCLSGLGNFLQLVVTALHTACSRACVFVRSAAVFSIDCLIFDSHATEAVRKGMLKGLGFIHSRYFVSVHAPKLHKRMLSKS